MGGDIFRLWFGRREEKQGGRGECDWVHTHKHKHMICNVKATLNEYILALSSHFTKRCTLKTTFHWQKSRDSGEYKASWSLNLHLIALSPTLNHFQMIFLQQSEHYLGIPPSSVGKEWHWRSLSLIIPIKKQSVWASHTKEDYTDMKEDGAGEEQSNREMGELMYRQTGWWDVTYMLSIRLTTEAGQGAYASPSPGLLPPFSLHSLAPLALLQSLSWGMSRLCG